MKIRYNENAEVVARLRAALLKRNLQCPCRLQKTEDNICMCKEFRDQIADPEFEGYCHCMLYYKVRPSGQKKSTVVKRCFFIPIIAAYPAGLAL